MSDQVNRPAARILIAEDEAIVAEDLALTLQDLGYQVVGTVSTGFLAIQLAEESKPDLILMDIKLGGEIDGIQASEQIRTRFDIPVIFLTAYEEADVISRAKLTEPYGFLAKPFSYYILKTTIEMALYKHAADKRVRESEERYRMLVEQSIEGIALIQGTVVRFVNPALAKMFGFQNEEEVEGQEFLTFVAPEYRDLMKKMGLDRDEGKPVPECYEFTALRKDGSPFIAEVRVNLTTYRGETARQGIIRDISERKKLEVALRQSQQMLSLAIEGADLGIWDWDLTTGKASWSERIFRMLGYTPNEFEPNLKNWRRFVHPDDWPGVRETLNLHLQGKLPKFEVLYRAPNKSEGWQWLQAQGTATEFDSHGKPLRITGIVADVTERKKAEEALRASQDRYGQLTENSLTGIFIHQDGVGVFVNQRLADMLGYTKEEMIGRNFFDAVHPDDHETVRARVQARLRGELSSVPRQLRLLKKTGEAIWCDVLATRIDYQGRPAIMGNLTDITDRKKAEEALKESEQRYRDLFENATDAMYTHDSDGNFTSANAAAEKVLGVDLERLLTMNVRDVVHPDDLPEVLQNLKIKAENGVTETGPYEIRILRADGTERWLEVTSRLVLQNGEQSLIQGVARDVTARKRAQEALIKSEQNFRELTERYRMLSENAPFGMVMISKEGVFEYVNSKFTEIFGYDLSDVPNGRVWLRKAYPDPTYRHQVISTWIEAFERLAPGEARSRIFEATCKDGSKKIVHFRPIKSGTGPDLMTCEDVTDRIRAEDARRETEDRYRSLVETSPDPIIMYDLEGNLITVNQQAATAYGVDSPEEALAEIKNVSDILDAESRKKAAENLKVTLATGSTRKNEYTLTRKDGGTLRVETNTSTVKSADGTPTAFISVIRDISDRKEVERRIRESEERFRSTFEQAAVGICHISPDGRFLRVNRKLCDILGYTSDELLSLTFQAITHPDDLDSDLEYVRQVLADKLKTYSMEKRYLRGDGSEIWANLTVSLTRHASGEPQYFISVVEDISSRKMAEQALRDSEERYRTLVSICPDGIFVTAEDRFAFANDAAARIFGAKSPDELVGKRPLDMVHPDYREAVRERTRIVLEEQKPVPLYERKTLRPDGTFVYTENAAAPILYRGQQAAQVVIRDITERKKAEEALRDSEAKYKVLVEESFDGILVHKETQIVFTNARLREMLGYGQGELEAQDPWLIFHPEYHEIMRERAKARLQGRPVPSRYELRMLRKDGASFEAESNARLIQIAGEPGIQVWIRDISERKQAENALRESEERFRTAFQTSPDPISISRLSDGVFIEVNKGFIELSGFRREEVIGKPSWEVNIWHDPGERDLLIAGLKERGHVTNLEARFRQKDGQVRAGLMSARIIVLDGEPHILAVTRDVENWKRAEQALRESEEKYRALFEKSIDAVYTSTREGILIDANQAFLDLFGFSREEAMNMDILRIYTDVADRKRLQKEIELKGSLKDYEVSFQKKDGTRIEALLTSTVRRDKDGSVLGYQGIVRDVTDVKQIQRQLLQAQKMEAVGTLTGGIAHDFNNLLQAILGYTDLLIMRKKAGDPDRHKLEVVRQAALDGADLVSRLLTFSMKAEFRARPTDLNQEIRRVEKLLRRMIFRMIKIDLVLSDDLRIIDADPAQIEQVLFNLSVNAQHAMPDSGRLLIETNNVSLSDEYLKSHLEGKPGNYVQLTVSDTGTGMKPEVLERIFEPFFTTKADGEGTGLGLAMVHGIVSQHGGYIRCYSEPGLGTSFKVYFPVSKTDRLLDVAETREMPAFGTETILLVDDDARIRDVAQEMIKMGGYRVLEASSGEEALAMYYHQKSEISLVILDLIMPGMGGKRCLEELLQIDPDLRVLFASGYSSNGLTVDETGTGARGFVRKPYDAKEILTAIRKVLDRGYL